MKRARTKQPTKSPRTKSPCKPKEVPAAVWNEFQQNLDRYFARYTKALVKHFKRSR